MFTYRVAARLRRAAMPLPFGLLVPEFIVAQAHAAEQSTVVISPVATMGKLAVALIVVLIVFWIFAKAMRQVQGFQGGMHHDLKIIGTLSVGQRERVVVVQVGEEQLILGVTTSQINTLHVLNKPLGQEIVNPVQGDFKTKLSAALKRQVTS